MTRKMSCIVGMFLVFLSTQSNAEVISLTLDYDQNENKCEIIFNSKNPSFIKDKTLIINYQDFTFAKIISKPEAERSLPGRPYSITCSIKLDQRMLNKTLKFCAPSSVHTEKTEGISPRLRNTGKQSSYTSQICSVNPTEKNGFNFYSRASSDSYSVMGNCSYNCLIE